MHQSVPPHLSHYAWLARWRAGIGSRIGIGLIVAVSACAGRPACAADLFCPPRMPGPHPGFDQVGPVPAAHWLLRRMRLFDTTRSQGAAKELAPGQTIGNGDGSTSTWRFSGNENLLMMCSYNGSGTYYVARPDPAPTLCVTHEDNGLTRAWCEEP